MTEHQFMTTREVLARLKIGRSTLYERIKAGRLPRPVHIDSSTHVRYLKAEIDAYMDALVRAARPESQGDQASAA